MNSDTGEMRRFLTDELAKKAGFNIPLADGEYDKLSPLSPEERVGEIVKMKHDELAAKKRHFKERERVSR